MGKNFTPLVAALLLLYALPSGSLSNKAAFLHRPVFPSLSRAGNANSRRALSTKMVVLELYYKQPQLLESLLPTVILPMHNLLQNCSVGGLSRVLLTFKGQESATANPVDVAVLRRELPRDVAVSCVWSAKNADVGTGQSARRGHATKEDATFSKFREYNDELVKAGCASILVVSGTGKKKALDSVATLSRVASSGSAEWLPIGVAFNPHIGGVLDPEGGESARELEWARLHNKLKSGKVEEVWISFGADVNALRLGLERLRGALGKQRPRLLGSVFVPSKAWIAKMRFRCWSGTFLGDKDAAGGYLSSVEAAAEVTRQILALYAAHGVEVVIESAVRTARDRDEALKMLQVTKQEETSREGADAAESLAIAESPEHPEIAAKRVKRGKRG